MVGASLQILITTAHLLASGPGAPRHPPSSSLGIQHKLASPLANYPSTAVNLPQSTRAVRKPVIFSLPLVQSAHWWRGSLNEWVCVYMEPVDAWIDTCRVDRSIHRLGSGHQVHLLNSILNRLLKKEEISNRICNILPCEHRVNTHRWMLRWR